VYQKERTDIILNILKENGYTTVKFLRETLHYSNATINRDLTILENQGLITRSYGGAELTEAKDVPIEFRYHKMKMAKNHIGKFASDLVNDGDTIFIDGSTTAESMGKYLVYKKDITVITNNMQLAIFLGEYGIKVICTGGEIVEAPSMLSGDDTIMCIKHYKTDKMFFSSGCISLDGKLSGSGIYSLLHQCAMENADKIYYLADHSKVGESMPIILCDLEKVDMVISDYAFPEKTKKKFKNTKFIKV